MRKTFSSLFLIIVLVILAASATRAQSAASTAVDLWNAVPDSDFVASFNVRKIVNEGLPRVLGDEPAARKDLENGTEGIRAETGLDVRRITRAVVGAKLVGTGLDVDLQELVVVAEGEFNYSDIKDSVKGPNREMREEKYGADTLLVFREYDDPKAKKNELVAVVVLGPKLIAAGYLNAVKRAVDAFREGKGRANPDLVTRAQSDPDALVSVAARIPAGYLQPKGMDASTNRLTRLLSSIKYVEAALHLGENGFPLTLAVRSDTTDSASDIKCMLDSIRTLADLAITDKATVKVLDDLKITLDGNAAVVQTEITMDQVRSIVNPPRPAQATKPPEQ